MVRRKTRYQLDADVLADLREGLGEVETPLARIEAILLRIERLLTSPNPLAQYPQRGLQAINPLDYLQRAGRNAALDWRAQ